MGHSFMYNGIGVLDWATSHLGEFYMLLRASQVALVVKDPPANAETISVPGSGRSPGGGHGNPLQYSCLENPMNRGAWQATVQSRKESYTTEATYHVHTCAPYILYL